MPELTLDALYTEFDRIIRTYAYSRNQAEIIKPEYWNHFRDGVLAGVIAEGLSRDAFDQDLGIGPESCAWIYGYATGQVLLMSRNYVHVQAIADQIRQSSQNNLAGSGDGD